MNSAPAAGPHRFGWSTGWVALLFVLNAALFPFAAIIADSGRDLANGLAIALGHGVPAYGPALFGIWHLGPAWYVLLALPLWLGGSVGAAAVFVGLLAAAKIPLAAALGRRLGDVRLGLLCAAFAALPGWQTLAGMALSHTALVETLGFAVLLGSLHAVQQRSPPAAVFAALLLGLALHAHPTTLVFAPAVAWAWWRGCDGARLTWLPMVLLVFVLPFVPVLAAEMRSGWPQLAGSAGWLGDSRFGVRLARAPQVLLGVTWHGSGFVREFLLQRVPGLGVVWQIGVVLLWLGTLAGAVLGSRRGEWRAAGALAAWLLALLFVCLLRDATPAWMTYALAPLQVLAWALGLWTLSRTPRVRARLTGVSLLVAAVIGAALLGDRFAVRAAGVQQLPDASIGDVAQPLARDGIARFWLAAIDHDAVARTLCGRDGPVALHGDLAAAVDFAQGVATRLHCGAVHVPQLGGRDAASHVAGIPQAVAVLLDFATPPAWGFVLQTPVQVLHPAQGRPIVLDTAYRAETFRALATHGERDVSVDARCAIGELLVVTNRLPGLNPLQIDATRGALVLAPRLQHLASTYFDCDGAPIRLRLTTLDPHALDVFVLGR